MTLTDLSYYLRKFGPVIVLGIILFMLLFVIMRMLLSLATPQPTPIFVPAFGELDKINFTSTYDYPQGGQFVLDNIEGRPVTATSSARVFFAPKPITKFGYIQTLLFMGKAVNIDTEKTPYELNGTEATYKGEQGELKIDIANFNFTYEFDFHNRAELFDDNVIPDENTIKETARTFLRQIDRFPNDFTAGTEHVIYLKYNPLGDVFSVLTDTSEANVVEVDFFPPNIDGFPTVSPKYFNSQNYVVMVFKSTGSQVIKAQIKYFETDSLSGSPYLLKTGDEAWDELTSGKGVIAAPNLLNKNKILVKEMFLGYYSPEEYQPYLQPVYVFIGDDNFVGYVPAVSNQYIKGMKQQTTPAQQ